MERLLILTLLAWICLAPVSTAHSAEPLDRAKEGLTALEQGNPDLAIDLFNEAVDDGSLSDENLAIVFYNRAQAWRNKKDPEKALNDCNLALRLLPDDGDFLYLRALVLVDMNRTQEARTDLDRIVTLRPEFAPARNTRGILKESDGDLAGALDDFSQATSLAPEQIQPHLNRGLILDRLGRLDEAIQEFDQAANLAPDSAEAYNNRGVALQRNGDLDRAMADLDRAILLNPDQAVPHYNRAKAWEAKGNPMRAVRDLNRALALDSEYADAYLERGKLHRAAGRRAQALEDLSRAAALAPTQPEAFLQRGLLLQEMNRPAEAAEDLGRVIQMEPGNAQAHRQLALIRKKTTTAASPASLPKPKQTASPAGTILPLPSAALPEQAASLFQEGLSLRRDGQPRQAIARFDQAIRLAPGYAEAYNSRGTCWDLLNEPGKALADFNEAIRINPSYGLAFFNRALAMKRAGRYANALADYEQALSLTREYYAYNALAWLLATCPDPAYRNGERAFQLARKAASLAGDDAPGLLDTLAAAYAELGRFGEAVEAQTRAIQMLGDRPSPSQKRYKDRLDSYRKGIPYRDSN